LKGQLHEPFERSVYPIRPSAKTPPGNGKDTSRQSWGSERAMRRTFRARARQDVAEVAHSSLSRTGPETGPVLFLARDRLLCRQRPGWLGPNMTRPPSASRRRPFRRPPTPVRTRVQDDERLRHTHPGVVQARLRGPVHTGHVAVASPDSGRSRLGRVPQGTTLVSSRRGPPTCPLRHTGRHGTRHGTRSAR